MFKCFRDLISAGINKGVILSLAKAGALDSILDIPKSFLLSNIEEIIEYYKKLDSWEEREKSITNRLHEIELWEISKEGPKPRRLPKNREKPILPDIKNSIPMSRQDRLQLEKETLGFYLTGHPLDDYEAFLAVSDCTISDVKDGTVIDGSVVSMLVVLSKITEIRTRSGKNMANLVVEDRTGIQGVTVFAKLWKTAKEELTESSIYILQAKVESLTSEDEDTKPITNLIALKIKGISKISELSPIEIKLKDGSLWTFYPTENQNIQKWNEASAIAKNIIRMG